MSCCAGWPRAGYSWQFDESAAGVPDTTVDTTGTSATSAVLADGTSWYVHVRAVGSPGWTFAMAFRDRLRADDDWRAEYAAAKARLAEGATSTTAYVDAKEPWFEPAWHAVQEWVRRTGWTPPEEPAS